jgi:Rab3 GTPase-activating protein catalytic subunit
VLSIALSTLLTSFTRSLNTFVSLYRFSMLDPVATGQTRGVQAQARSCIQSRSSSSSSSSDSTQQQQQQCFTEQQRLCPYPDMRLCLTAQKLQLLNCCIEQRLGKLLDSSSADATDATASATTAGTADASGDADSTAAAGATSATTATTAAVGDTADTAATTAASVATTDAALIVLEEADDDDEFFDSRDATSALPSPAQSPRYACNLNKSSVSSSAVIEPVLPQLCPLTSDMLPEHAAAAPRLLAAVAAADAAAFKCANPSATPKDFVQWYCCRGSSNSSSNKQQVQAVARTAAAEVWNKSSKRAQQHRALFDVAQEAEKALHHLVSITAMPTIH